MDKYERVGKKIAKSNQQKIIEHNGKVYVYNKDSYREPWYDEPDETYQNWTDYTKNYIGKVQRRLRTKNTNKHLRRN